MIARDLLLNSLKSVHGTIESRHAQQILSHALIQIEPGTVRVTANDYAMQVCVQASADTNGAALNTTVAAHRLLDILRRLPAGSSLELAPLPAEKIRIGCAGSTFTLRTLPAQQYPTMPDMAAESVTEAKLAARDLKMMLLRTVPAMAQQDIRYYLMGGLLTLRGPDMTLTGTDGIRLVTVTRAAQDASGEAAVIVPRKTLAELHDLLPDSDDLVSLRANERQAVFAFGGVAVTSSLIDGRYPDFARTIPVECAQCFRADRLELLHALERAVLLLGKFRGTRWTVTGGRLLIESQNADDEQCEELVAVQHDGHGEGIEFGLNADLVLETLRSLPGTERIECGFNGFNSAMLMTIPGDEAYRYVQMPVKL
jgi:DNA polymerase-3 subunit beta